MPLPRTDDPLSRAVETLREQLAGKDVTIAYLRQEVETLLSLLGAQRSWWRRWFR